MGCEWVDVVHDVMRICDVWKMSVDGRCEDDTRGRVKRLEPPISSSAGGNGSVDTVRKASMCAGVVK